jgi:hypothetical protein
MRSDLADLVRTDPLGDRSCSQATQEVREPIDTLLDR